MSGIPPGRNWHQQAYDTPQVRALRDDRERRKRENVAYFLATRQGPQQAAAAPVEAPAAGDPRARLRQAIAERAAAEAELARRAADVERRSLDLAEKREELALLVRAEEELIVSVLNSGQASEPHPTGLDNTAAKSRLEVWLRVGERELELARAAHKTAAGRTVAASEAVRRCAYNVRVWEIWGEDIDGLDEDIAAARAKREVVAAFGRLRYGYGFPAEFSAVLNTKLPGDDKPYPAAPALLEAEHRAATAREADYLRRLYDDPEAEFEEPGAPPAA